MNFPFAWGVFVLGIILINPSHAQELRPRVIDRDPDDGSPVVHRFDVFELKDGRIMYANPSWSGKRPRPIDVTGMTSVPFIAYGQQRGVIGIPISNIRKFTYWEALATSESERYLDQGKDWVAALIIKELVAFNPQWPGLEGVRARLDVREIDTQIRNGDVEGGLRRLDQLRRRLPLDKRLEASYVQIMLSLAKNSVGGPDDDLPTSYLKQLEKAYPQNALVRGLAQDWAAEAESLTVEAERLQVLDSGAAIDAAQRAVQLTRQDNLRQRARVVLRNAEGLIVSTFDKPTVFEPLNAVRPVERHIASLTYQTLTRRKSDDPGFEPTEILDNLKVERFGQEYKLQLKAGLRFSDGSPITTSDLARSIDLLRDHRGEAFNPSWMRYVKASRVDGPQQLVVSALPHPEPLSLFSIPVLSRSDFQEFPLRDYRRKVPNAVSGPFRVRRVDPEGGVELLSNPHAPVKPRLGKIQFRYYPNNDVDSAIEDLRSQRVHWLADPTPLQLQTLSQFSNRFVIHTLPSRTVWILAISHRSLPFSDRLHPGGEQAARDMRRAIALAIDREKILRQLFQVTSPLDIKRALATGPFPFGSKAQDSRSEPRQPDPPTAKEIVKRQPESIRNGPSLKLKYVGESDFLDEVMARLHASIEGLGVTVDLVKRNPQDFYNELQAGSFDLAYYPVSHRDVLMDLSWFLDPTPISSSDPRPRNFMGYRKQSLTQLLEELRRATRGEDVWKTQQQIDGLLRSEVVFVPLWQLDRHIVHTKRLVRVEESGLERKIALDPENPFLNVQRWYLHPKR
ncbi:MAG: ABC transporter substrate-binding protein [Planctomycetota bacterium]